MKIGRTDFMQQKTSFKAIYVDKSLTDNILQAIANSKHMKSIAKKYNASFMNYRYSDVFENNVMTMEVEKLQQEFNGPVIIRACKKFINAINPKIYNVLLTQEEGKPSLVKQLSELTPQKIEEFINKEEQFELQKKVLRKKMQNNYSQIASLNK